MTYASAPDMVDRFGEAEMNGGTVGGQPVPGFEPAAIAAALADASAVIDARIGARYALPLSAGPWPMLTSIACDLARRKLYDEDPPEEVSKRASMAIARMKEIQSGDLALVDAGGTEAPRRTQGAVLTRDQVFTADALRNF